MRERNYQRRECPCEPGSQVRTLLQEAPPRCRNLARMQVASEVHSDRCSEIQQEGKGWRTRRIKWQPASRLLGTPRFPDTLRTENAASTQPKHSQNDPLAVILRTERPSFQETTSPLRVT
jgi:hypothetical protein